MAPGLRAYGHGLRAVGRRAECLYTTSGTWDSMAGLRDIPPSLAPGTPDQLRQTRMLHGARSGTRATASTPSYRIDVSGTPTYRK